MKSRRVPGRAAVFVVIVLFLQAVQAQEAHTGRLVISHVTVVDVRTGQLLADRDVTVVGDRIASVEPATSAPRQGTDSLIDGRGKYLIPGLWDCHVHLSWTTESALPLLVALGITEVRDLGGKLSEIDSWWTQIAIGTMTGPHIMRVGPILNGQSFNAYQFVPGSAEATRGAVRLLDFLGMDEIKVHRRMPKDWYYAAIDEARKLEIPVVGHIPMEVTPEEASNAGQYMIEHTETLFEGTFSRNLTDVQIPGQIRSWLATNEPDRLFTVFAKNGTWVDPTVSGYLEVADMLDPAVPVDPRYRYVASSQRKQWLEQQRQHPISPDEQRAIREHMNLLIDVTGRMYRNHVRLVAGTDAAGPRLVGFSLHRELALLVRAGLSPLEALQTATLNPALAFHRTEDLGTIEAGKLADLVILDANPVEQIENTERINSVIVDGRLFGRAELDGLLRKAEYLAKTH